MKVRPRNVVVIGAGHNGLILATLLADFGCHVELLEARDHIGGAAENFRFDCGCMVSRAANSLKLLDKSVVSLLERLPSFKPSEFVYTPHVQTLIRTPCGDLSVGNLDFPLLSADLSEQTGEDAGSVERFFTDLQAATDSVAALWTDPYATRAVFRERLSSVGPHFPHLFLDGSIQQTAAFYFKNNLLALSLCDLCNLIASPPSDDSSAYCLLYLASGNSYFASSFAVPKFGMGHVAQLLTDVAVASGVKIFRNCVVKKAYVKDLEVNHVELADGRKFTGDIFVSAVGPATTQRWVVPATSRIPQLKLSAYETAGVKLCCLAPREVFLEAFGPPSRWPGQLILSETRDDFYDSARLAANGLPSPRPLVELTFPAVSDIPPSCAQHIPFSIYALYFPYDWWVMLGEQEGSSEAVNRVRHSIARWYPSLASKFSVADILSPLDCEKTYGMYRGDVDHGSFGHGNILESRGYGQLPHGSTYYDNLYNCSAGIHPGGLISGRPGIVCASTIMERIGG